MQGNAVETKKKHKGAPLGENPSDALTEGVVNRNLQYNVYCTKTHAYSLYFTPSGGGGQSNCKSELPLSDPIPLSATRLPFSILVLRDG